MNHVGAVCVYPNAVPLAARCLYGKGGRLSEAHEASTTFTPPDDDYFALPPIDDSSPNVQILSFCKVLFLMCTCNSNRLATRTRLRCVRHHLSSCSCLLQASPSPGVSVGLASVATGFPTGQYPLASRVLEVRRAVEEGASEIDIVLDRALVLAGDWRGVPLVD